MKKLAKFLIISVAIFALMFVEYRFIMTNLRTYYAEDGFICIEFMGQTDAYYAEPIFVNE